MWGATHSRRFRPILTFDTVSLGEIDMSSNIYDITVRRDYSGLSIEEWNENSYTIGYLSDKTDWDAYRRYYRDESEQLMLWYGDFTMTEFVNLLMEYSDLGYYQLKNRCKAIVKGSQMTLDIVVEWPYRVHPIRWGGSVKIEDPVLAQAILDTYN